MNCELYTSVLSDVQLRRGLQTAQMELAARRTSALSRFTYYLRICCFMMHKIEWRSQDGATSTRHAINYTELVKLLNAHDPLWWQKCYVNEHGVLQSDDPIIQNILKPVAEFYCRARRVIAAPASSEMKIGQASTQLSA